ncbi:hypothetical protein [Lacrimispora indolis]|uniref:hypothetical protein n=1 Tax=Lacrimispora indolis TaxID=69825 RepID=UPI0003F911D3|nr:hypothetical protein [[Clostridium] methoxybenzovorans]
MKKSKVKRLLVVTGALVLLALGATGCSAKPTAVPAESTQVETTVDPEEQFKVDIPLELEDPTTEVVETIEDGGEIGVTANGETVYSFGKYGELGKTVFDNLASSWVHWKIADEAALRQVMDATYGDLSTKEELTQEILAMERDAQSNPATAETKAETPTPQESKPATQPTKPTNESNNNSNNTTPTTVSQEQNIPAQTSSNYTPEQIAKMKEEAERRRQEDLANKPEEEDRGVDIGQDQDFDSAAGQWDWD